MTLYENRGGALMLAVGYLAVMTVAASGFLAMLHHRMGVVRAQERAQISRHLAEAGIEAAVASFGEPGGAPVSIASDLGEGGFHVSVTPGAHAGWYTIVSIGELVYDGVVAKQTRLAAEVTVDAQGRVIALTWNPEPTP